MQTVHYVIQLVGSRYESVIVEKNLTLAKQHSTRYASSMYVCTVRVYYVRMYFYIDHLF